MASQTVVVGGYKIWKQGFLLKAPSRGTMRRRLERYWFVLFQQKDQMAFLYFQDEDHFLERKKNKGFFRFDDATSVDVVKDYMGKKNAFCIATPRNKYYIVSESRYELHQWIYIIHHALEDFRRRQTQPHKPPSRGRTISSTGGTPTHKASPRVKPSRPAPPAPKLKKSRSQVDEEPSNELLGSSAAEEPPVFDNAPLSPTTPLDNIVAGLLADANHMQDVEYELTEEEPHHDHDISPPESEAQAAVESPSAVNGVDEARSDRETSEERDKCSSWDQLTDSLDNITDRSTMPMDRASNKKRNRKHSGSVKAHRSVSPPNLPPPPPPLIEDSPEKQAKSPQKITTLQNFESELDQISQELAQKPKARPPIPARTTSLPPGKVPGDVGEYMDEAFHQDDLGNISPELIEDRTSREPPKFHQEVSDVNLTMAEGGQDVTRKGGTPMGHRRQVAFEGSATERPDPSYEPRIDKESLPSSVAEAKKQLFGDQEAETARYRRLNTNNNNDSGGESASPGTPKRTTSVSDELFQSIESALQTTNYMEKQSMDSKTQGLWPAMLAGSQGVSLEQACTTKSSPQQPLSKDWRPVGLSHSSERLHKIEVQTTSPTHYSPSGSQLKRHQSQPRSMQPSSLRQSKGKKVQPDYNTLPTWSQMKASGMHVSVESDSQTQKTVYRSLV